MIITLNSAQILKISDLFMDLAKGLLLASFVAPSISSFVTLLSILKSAFAGLFFAYMSLLLLTKNKEEI